MLSTLRTQFTWNWPQFKGSAAPQDEWLLPGQPGPPPALPPACPPVVCSCCTRKRSPKRPYLSGPRTQLKASNQRPPRAVELVLLDKGRTSCMWLGTGRKQGHYQGSMASGQRKRILGVIKVLTDKNCSRPLCYRKGTFIEGQTENISFRDLSRLHIPQPRTWLRVRAQWIFTEHIKKHAPYVGAISQIGEMESEQCCYMEIPMCPKWLFLVKLQFIKLQKFTRLIPVRPVDYRTAHPILF